MESTCAGSPARVRRTSTPRSRRRGARSPRGPSRPSSSAATSSATIALRLRERREELSAAVVAETGKPEALALAETDAAVEMGLFVAGEGRRFYGRTTTASMPHRTVLSVRRPVGVAGAADVVQHPVAERRLEGVPVAPLRQRIGRETIRGDACLGVPVRARCA